MRLVYLECLLVRPLLQRGSADLLASDGAMQDDWKWWRSRRSVSTSYQSSYTSLKLVREENVILLQQNYNKKYYELIEIYYKN